MNNNHGHKEPPLQSQVSHKQRLSTNIAYYLSMAFFTIMLGITLASALDS